MTERGFLLLSLTCALLACACFLPGLHGGFLFDDKPNIVQNTGMWIAGIDHYSLWRAANSFPGSPGLRPLSMLSLALDFWLYGLNPVAFKSTNLLIHGLTTVFLASLFRHVLLLARCTSRQAMIGALALALVWALHPLQVSSVLYVVQRMQTLSTLFLVLALLAYLTARQAQMTGAPSRKFWVRSCLFWLLALASKEDAILLPAYTLALELTVLRFEAAHAWTARRLRQVYGGMVVVSGLAFLFIVMPHFWATEAYPGRNFNTPERLLTQGRVLVMYLGQILLPLPDHLLFYYDHIQPSRGWLQPPATLWAVAFLLGLLLWAWRWRQRRPVFALGVFLFFAAHIVTSNVIGLELAFEHRNHFPLIGAVLAVADLLALAATRLRMSRGVAAAGGTLLLACLATASSGRAYVWGDALRLAEKSARIAPDSVRAWGALCRANYDLSAGDVKSPYFEAAIAACERGGEAPASAHLLANVVVMKSINGTVAPEDWNRFLARLETVVMNVENAGVAENMVRNAIRGTPLDEQGVIQVIETVSRRASLGEHEYVQFGYYFLGKANRPEDAEKYFLLAANAAAPGDRLILGVIDELRKFDHGDLAGRIEMALAK